MLRKYLFFSVAVLFLFSKSVFAGIFDVSSYDPYGPLPVRTQNPLHLLFISQPLERTETLPQGKSSSSIDFSFSNLFERHIQAVGVGLDLDMELARTALRTHYGLTDRIEIGVELPFLSFSAGFLDSFIQGYHNAFGFPNAGRQKVDQGRFSYRATNNGAVLYRVDQSSFGLSDLVLHQKFKLFDETKTIPAFAIRTSLKLPTGSRSEGTGSGEVDMGFTLLAEKSYKRLHSYSQIGFLALGVHDDLSLIQKKGGFVFGESVEFNLFEHLSMLVQIDLISPLFQNVQISELSDPAVDLTICFTGERFVRRGLNKVFYRAALMEDVTSTGPSVDFTLFFNLGMVY